MGGPASTTPGHLLEGVVSVGSATPLDAIEGQRDLAFESNEWAFRMGTLCKGLPLILASLDAW